MTGSVWSPNSQTTPSTPEVTPHLFVPGSSSAPGIGFVGDTNSGLFDQAVGNPAIVASGTVVVDFDNLGGVNLHGKIAFSGEQTIAAAATTDIGSVESNLVQVTGNIGITSFGVNYKGPMFVRFSGTPIISPSATLLTPGGVAISVQAGESCIVTPFEVGGVQFGWAIISYQKATGASSSGGGATGGGSDTVFQLNKTIMTASYTLPTGWNALLVGPLQISTGVVLTVPTGQRLVVL